MNYCKLAAHGATPTHAGSEIRWGSHPFPGWVVLRYTSWGPPKVPWMSLPSCIAWLICLCILYLPLPLLHPHPLLTFPSKLLTILSSAFRGTYAKAPQEVRAAQRSLVGSASPAVSGLSFLAYARPHSPPRAPSSFSPPP